MGFTIMYNYATPVFSINYNGSMKFRIQNPKFRNLEQTYILNAPKDIWMYFSFIYTSDLI